MKLLPPNNSALTTLTKCIITTCALALSSCLVTTKEQAVETDLASIVQNAISNNPECARMCVKKHIIIAGDSMCVELPKGQNIIYNLNIEIRGDAKDVIINGMFDGVKTIKVPFTALTDSLSMECSDYMPYTNCCNFTLVNSSKKDIDATFITRSISTNLNDKMQYYHAQKDSNKNGYTKWYGSLDSNSAYIISN
ncbi:MAG: hypothetical protein RR513_07200 [Muribaculaceae bacterium]